METGCRIFAAGFRFCILSERNLTVMYKIIRKEVLNPTITLLDIEDSSLRLQKRRSPDNLLFFVLTKRENAFR